MSTVVSPAGDLVEVLETPAPERAHWRTVMEPVLAALWWEGPVTSEAGTAAAELWLRASERGYRAMKTGLSHLLQNGTLQHFVERDSPDGSRRTYSIRLARLPRQWLDLLQSAPEPEPEVPAAPAVSSNRRPVLCPAGCGKSITLNNLQTHLRGPHGYGYREASDAAKAARHQLRTGQALVPVVSHSNGDQPELVSPLSDISAVEAVYGILSAARTDGLMPTRLLPAAHDLIRHTEAVLAELRRLTDQ